MTTLDPELFLTQSQGDLTLIVPSKDSVKSSNCWTRDNLWYRSRIETPSGRTVSNGFGKFFNLGQKYNELGYYLSDIVEYIEAGNSITATLKYDGSLLIRSVYNGKVILRTRGSFQYTFHDKAEDEMSYFKTTYPKLLDPSWHPDKSLLFEWVSPDAQVVLVYPQTDLTLIGAVHHGHGHVSHLKYLCISELIPISEESGIKLVEYQVISSLKDWYDLYHSILPHTEIEGYVIRFKDEQELVKIKADPYLTKHSLKFELSFKKLVDMWLQHGPDQSETVVKQLEALYNEEVVMWALPLIVSLEDAVNKWREYEQSITSYCSTHFHLDRKDYAIHMQNHFDSDPMAFAIAMTLYTGGSVSHSLIKKFLVAFDKSISEEKL